jgi:hypothetical protein
MGSTVNVSAAIYKAGTGSKHAAGEVTPTDQCSDKRQRISRQEPRVPIQQSLSNFVETQPSVIGNDLQEREFEEAEAESEPLTQGEIAIGAV